MTDRVGQTLLGRYRLDAVIGGGGMAEVYRAWDANRCVYLALKMLPEDLAQDHVFLRRFRKEARVLELLQHPYRVRYCGLEQDDLLAFMLMDFLDGSTLRTEIFWRKAPSPLEDIRRYFQPICAALHFAHSQGVVHCDMKPANVLIDKGGRARAKAIGSRFIRRTLTAATKVGATKAYLGAGVSPRWAVLGRHEPARSRHGTVC